MGGPHPINDLSDCYGPLKPEMFERGYYGKPLSIEEISKRAKVLRADNERILDEMGAPKYVVPARDK